ncbi:hypothetical protein Cgig2_023013 [Carnegiea gigantea]|uniref:Uncharacterized protein n=1 Tax=Carnegiea gigantea TaxID=171969 RepID=A0A9Q1K7M4_9CARY|nr:hypothetical protein Cgig2_023013 [Carnegiea gigantea]
MCLTIFPSSFNAILMLTDETDATIASSLKACGLRNPLVKTWATKYEIKIPLGMWATKYGSLKPFQMITTTRRTLGQIIEWRKKEEVLWWQRAHSDCVKYGDANSRWFHLRANMRRAKNTITGLQDSVGICRTSHASITSIDNSSLMTYSPHLSLQISRIWLPYPISFKPITLHSRPYEDYKVSDLINR